MSKQNNLLTYHVNETIELLSMEYLNFLGFQDSRSSLDNRNNVIWMFNVTRYSINQVRVTIDWRAKTYEVRFEYSEQGVFETVAVWTATKENLKTIVNKIKYFKK